MSIKAQKYFQLIGIIFVAVCFCPAYAGDTSPQTTCSKFFSGYNGYCTDAGNPGNFWACFSYNKYTKTELVGAQYRFRCVVDMTETGHNYSTPINNTATYTQGPYVTACDDPNTVQDQWSCKPKPPPCDPVSDPIFPATGQVSEDDIDFQASGSFPLRVQRHYLGLISEGNWYFNDLKHLAVYDVTDNSNNYLFTQLTFTRPNGHRYVFEWTDVAGYTLTQAKNVNQIAKRFDSGSNFIGWKFITPVGEEHYDKDGNLEKDINSSGLSHSFVTTLTGSTQTVVVTDDQTGLQITYHLDDEHLTSSGMWQVNSVTLPDSSVVSYGYMTTWPGGGTGNGMLETVTYPTTSAGTLVKTYSYADINGNGSLTSTEKSQYKNFLTGLDEDGTRYSTWTYNTNGRAISNEHGTLGSNFEKTTIAYTLAGDGSVSQAAIVNPSGAASTRYYADDAMGTKQLMHVEGAAAAGGCAASDSYTSYDANGYVATRKDARGYVTSTDHDAQGRVTTLKTALGSGSGNPESPESQKIETTWHSNTALNLFTQKKYYGRNSGNTAWSLYRTDDFTYDDGSGSGGTYNCDGNSSLNTYRVCSRTVTDNINSVSRSWAYSYTLQSGSSVLATQIINGPLSGSGDTTTYNYNSYGQLTSVVNAASQTTSYADYNSFGLPETITDPNSIVTEIAYNARGQVETITADVGGIAAVTEFEYYPNGLLKKTIQADGSYLEYVYNSAHQLISIVNNFGEHIDLTPSILDGKWTLAKIYKASGTSSGDLTAQYERVFDALGRLSKIKNASGAEKQVFGYDVNDNITTRILKGDGEDTVTTHDKNDIAIEMAYDALNRLITASNPYTCNDNDCVDTYNNADETPTSPAPAETVYAYDNQGNIKTVTDANSHTTTYTYNGFGELVTQVTTGLEHTIQAQAVTFKQINWMYWEEQMIQNC